jgi:hypothetical protein
MEEWPLVTSVGCTDTGTYACLWFNSDGRFAQHVSDCPRTLAGLKVLGNHPAGWLAGQTDVGGQPCPCTHGACPHDKLSMSDDSGTLACFRRC